MAQDKDQDKQKEQPVTGNGSLRKAAETGDKRTSTSTGRAPRASAARVPDQGGQAQRRQQYLIAVRSAGSTLTGFDAAAFQPQSIDAVVDYLTRQEGVEIVGRMKPAGSQPFAPNGAFSQEIVVARIAEDRAQTLLAAADPRIIVEPDGPLIPGNGVAVPMRGRVGVVKNILPLSSVVDELSLQIVDERDQPLPRAAVVVYGPGFPVQAVTDETGTARLKLFGGWSDSVRAIYVKPAANCWERLLVAPELNSSGATTIKLRPLTETFSGSPNDRAAPWDRRLMRMDRLPESVTGAGIRVAIIDSGCDNTQPALRHVTRGKDFTTRRADGIWTDDALGYGTHSAGLIAATASAGQGMPGCAPEAELHVFRVFPGGRASDLLAALDECIAREIDVVSINVGYDEESELLAQRLREARHKGIACIAAAGNSFQAPAVFPTVLAVGAVGALRTFPQDTCHARAVVPESIGNDGVFPAAFTGVGVNIGVSAPGVAVLSTVPGGHAALDGTGAAASLVAGMATLILAHHPLFQGPLKARSEQRVSALFGLIRASAIPHFVDPLRGGAGVPDLQRVPGWYDITAGARGAASDVFEDAYATGMYSGAPLTAVMPLLRAWPAAGPALAAEAWGPLMQHLRRTAGF